MRPESYLSQRQWTWTIALSRFPVVMGQYTFSWLLCSSFQCGMFSVACLICSYLMTLFSKLISLDDRMMILGEQGRIRCNGLHPWGCLCSAPRPCLSRSYIPSGQRTMLLIGSNTEPLCGNAYVTVFNCQSCESGLQMLDGIIQCSDFSCALFLPHTLFPKKSAPPKLGYKS